MAVLILLAAFNTGTNLLYIMGGTLLSLLTLSLVYGRLNVARLSATLETPTEEYQDRESTVAFTLGNTEGRIVRYGLIAGAQCSRSDPEKPRTLFTMIAPNETQERHAPIRFLRRGVARMDSIELVSYFPLSMIEYRRRIPCDAETLVYPKLIPIGRRFGGLSAGPGQQELAVKGHGSELHAIREYVPGDPARDIHWKLSAKGTGIKIREYESEATSEIELLLDFPIPEGQPTPAEVGEFEMALSVAASLARHYIDEARSVGLWTAGGEVPFGDGANHLRRIYRALATLEIETLDPRAIRPGPALNRQQIWIAAGVGHRGAPAFDSPTAQSSGRLSSRLSVQSEPGSADIRRVDARALYEEGIARVDRAERAEPTSIRTDAPGAT